MIHQIFRKKSPANENEVINTKKSLNNKVRNHYFLSPPLTLKIGRSQNHFIQEQKITFRKCLTIFFALYRPFVEPM